MRLIQPSALYLADWRLSPRLSQRCRLHGRKEPFKIRKTWPQWLKQYEDFHLGHNLPNDWMPTTQYICVRESDDKLVGMINVRHRLNVYLEKYGEHIGYSVRPDVRGKGYGKWMLDAILPHCRSLQLEKVLITCNDTNIASRKCILSCGGVCESTVMIDDERIEHYWIQI